MLKRFPPLLALLSKRRYRVSLAIVVALILSMGVINFSLDTDSNSALPVPRASFTLGSDVEASCTVILNAKSFQQDEVETEKLTLLITLPDGTPLAGVCITFTRDMGLGVPEEVVAICTTDEAGRCTIDAPGGIINVYFGNTKIGGLPLNNASDTVDALTDGSRGGVNYFFPGNEPAEENVVASVSDDGSSVSMEPGHTNEDGELEPFHPGPDLPPGVGWGNWDLYDFPFTYGGGIEILPTGPIFNTDLPEGIVTVRFTPRFLQTSAAYERAYCYYATGDSGYTRVPAVPGTFLPGGGTFFDLGAVLNGERRPSEVLDAETQPFDISMECWGWQGNELVKMGTGLDSQQRELWRGQELALAGSGFAVDYRLAWYGPDLQPESPRLILNPVIPDTNTGIVPPSPDSLYIAADSARFTSELTAPINLAYDGELLTWDYNGEATIGGFRIYRGDYLIGDAPPQSRGWTGDGLKLGACGDPAQIRMTTFIGGTESLSSDSVEIEAPPCSAKVTVGFDTAQFTAFEDCDGDNCGQTGEIYGLISVNDFYLAFGGSGSPGYVSVKNETTYPFTRIIRPFGASTQVPLLLGATDALAIEIILFDRDTNTTDDVVCTWSEVLPARDTEEWLSQTGRPIIRDAAAGEGQCTFSLSLTVEAPDLPTDTTEVAE